MMGGGLVAQIAWLGFCFGTVIIGLLILFFAPALLFLPFTFLNAIGYSSLGHRDCDDFGRRFVATGAWSRDVAGIGVPVLHKKDSVHAGFGGFAGPTDYVSTWQGWLYVAFVINVLARRIVIWRVSSTMRTDFVLDAL